MCKFNGHVLLDQQKSRCVSTGIFFKKRALREDQGPDPPGTPCQRPWGLQLFKSCWESVARGVHLSESAESQSDSTLGGKLGLPEGEWVPEASVVLPAVVPGRGFVPVNPESH